MPIRARGAALVLVVAVCGCTLTESLDDLRGSSHPADADVDGSTGGTGGAGGAWPDGGGATAGTSGTGASGNGGASGGGSGGSGGAGGSGGVGGSGTGGSTGGSGGTPGCGSGEKLCGTTCVSLSDPDYGCGSPSCSNCSLPHATETCSGGACAVGSCSAGWGDCNGDDDDGCETDLDTDVNNCGGCGFTCSIPNGNGSCSAGSCSWSSCASPYADCDGNLSNGCEQNLNFCSCFMSCTPCITCCAAPGVCLQCSC